MRKEQQSKACRAVLAVAIGALVPRGAAQAAEKVKVGLMLPYTGTYAALGNAITNGFKQHVAEQGGTLGGREVEYFVVDDESDPSKATENASKLIKRDQVDVLVGTVHSGVALAMAKVARDTNTLLIIPNAGADELTGPLCAPNIFLVHELAAGLCNGQGRSRTRPQERGDADVEIRRRRAGRRRLQGSVREGRRQGREGTLPAVPERRVPALPDRNRESQAGCRVRVLRRRRRGEVRQGLRCRRAQAQHPAVRFGLPH